MYAERGVYRSGETAYITALLRDAQGTAALGVPLTFVVQRPDGVEFRRTVVADQGVGGHALTLALPGSAPSGTWHVQAFTDPKRPPVGETTFLVEDYVPDRIEFDLTSAAARISQKSPAEVDRRRALPLWRAGHRPRSRRRYDHCGGQGAEPALPVISSALTMKRSKPVQQPLDDLPTTDANGKANFPSLIDKLPSTTHPLQAQHRRAHGRARRPRRRAHADFAGDAERQHDRHQAAVLRPLACRRRERDFRRRGRGARWHGRLPSAACTISCCASIRTISSTSATASGISSR